MLRRVFVVGMAMQGQALAGRGVQEVVVVGVWQKSITPGGLMVSLLWGLGWGDAFW